MALIKTCILQMYCSVTRNSPGDAESAVYNSYKKYILSKSSYTFLCIGTDLNKSRRPSVPRRVK